MERKKLKLKARELIRGRVFRIFFFMLIVVSLIPFMLSLASSLITSKLFADNTVRAEAGQVINVGNTNTFTTVLTTDEWKNKIKDLDLTGCLRLAMDRSVRNIVVEGDSIFPTLEAEKQYVLTSTIVEIITLFITLLTTGALVFSGLSGMLKIDKDKKAPRLSEDFFSGFKKNNYARAIIASLRVGIFVFLWSLLFVVPGIMKAYSYIMTMYILADNPKLSAKEAQEKSIALMRGHRFEYFKLQISFFWWYLLIGATFGLAGLYVAPYIETSKMLFYKKLAKK